ncbi:MAG: tRNA (adenosine(37)-N6)-threonylcarbamoyltransferase complex transferase subunit TsaD [Clostridia bacterium]|nr:tRNA (adenosine(37)-N6)-threonylcarbamoyltransferase complex transferase subunit TsaD [Clostridia bacterium]
MIIFGMESSCDDTAAAVLDVNHTESGNEYRLLSNIVSSQTAIHAEYGGVVPEIASRAHAEQVSAVAAEAMKKAGITHSDIDAVAVTFAPGLIGSLLVGVSYAKALASALDVPLIPVNHIEAHASAAYLEYPELPESFLALIVSGGHTSFYDVKDHVFTEIGGSRDDAAGEAFDKVGRVMGLPYPGGAAMDRLAAAGFERDDWKAIKFPSPAMNDGTLEFSFSGLKTAVINHIHKTVQRSEAATGADLPLNVKEDIAAAFTAITVKGICAKLEEAVISNNYTHIVLAGGVAANSHLRGAAEELCLRLGVKLCAPSLALCGDNGAMTAAAGAALYRQGVIADSRMNAFASDEGAMGYLAELRSRLDGSRHKNGL